MTPKIVPRKKWTALESIGALGALFIVFGLFAFPVSRFEAIFLDLGPAEELPGLTRLALSRWLQSGFAVSVVALLTGGILARGSRGRLVCIGAAVVIGLVGIALCSTAMYLPIFSITGKIKAD